MKKNDRYNGIVPKKKSRGYDTPLSITSNKIVNGIVSETDNDANKDDVKKQLLNDRK